MTQHINNNKIGIKIGQKISAWFGITVGLPKGLLKSH